MISSEHTWMWTSHPLIWSGSSIPVFFPNPISFSFSNLSNDDCTYMFAVLFINCVSAGKCFWEILFLHTLHNVLVRGLQEILFSHKIRLAFVFHRIKILDWVIHVCMKMNLPSSHMIVSVHLFVPPSPDCTCTYVHTCIHTCTCTHTQFVTNQYSW